MITTMSKYLLASPDKIAMDIVEYNIGELDFDVPKDLIDKSVTYQTSLLNF